MMDTTKLYIFGVSQNDLDLVLRPGMQEIKTSGPILARSLQVNLKKFGNAVQTCWFDEPHIYFISSDQYSRKRTLFRWFCTGIYDVGVDSDIYRLIFKLDVMIDTMELYW